MTNLDEIDYKILSILQEKGRTRRNEIAELVNLSIPSTSERLRKLEENSYIIEYNARLNSVKLGIDITAFIFVSIDTSKHFHSFIEHANSLEEVQEVHAITGEGSHLLKIRTENTASLERLLAKISAWPGVLHTKTHLVLSSPKETIKIKLQKK